MPVSNKEKLNIALTGTTVAVGLFTGSTVLAGLIGGVSHNWLADLSWRGWEAARDHWLTPDGRSRHEPLVLASKRAIHQGVSAFLQEEAYHKLPAAQQHWCRDGIADLERMLLGHGDETAVDPQVIVYGDVASALADLRRVLLDTIFHDPPPAFSAFLKQQLTPDQLALRFTAELQQDQEARDAYQQLLLENVARQANTLLAEQQSVRAALQATLAALQKWQTMSPEEQRAAFAEALTAELAKLTRKVEEEGAKTRAKLDEWGQIILDKVEPTRTFPIDNLPQPNPHFVGRAEHLQTIAGHFSPEPLTITQAITGLGGVGKSQLMLAYAHQQRANYDLIWLLRVDEALAEDFLSLGRALRLPVDDLGQPQAVQAVRQWLNSCPQRWLLLYDNADQTEPADLYPYLPANPQGRILITSRYPHWQARGATLPLDVFTPAEAAAFWAERLVQSRRLDQSDAAALADTLGRLPLAMEHAAAYINSRRLDAAAYLELYGQRRQELWRRAKPPDDYHATITTTWEIGFAQVRRTPGAVGLLNLCCFLAPDDIPLKLLIEAADALPEELATVMRDPLARDDALAALERYSLLERADGALRLHRLVQEVARDRMGTERAEKWAEAAVFFLAAAYPFDKYVAETWPVSRELIPHNQIAASLAQRHKVASEKTVWLWNQTAEYLQIHGDYQASLTCVKNALIIAERSLDPDHLDTAYSLNNLGYLLRAMGDLAGARPYYERALAIRKKALGPDHSDTAQSLNNLAALLQAMGDLAEARPYYERALAIHEKAFGPDHPHTALSLNNLGYLLQAMGDLAGARPYFERALAIREKALGPDHPDTAQSLNNLGMLLKALGDLAGARPYLERALTITEKALGSDHPDTANRLNNLGKLAEAEGDISQAREYLSQALSIFERALGKDHPNSNWVRRNLQSLPS